MASYLNCTGQCGLLPKLSCAVWPTIWTVLGSMASYLNCTGQCGLLPKLSCAVWPPTWTVLDSMASYVNYTGQYSLLPELYWGGIQRQMLKHSLIFDWAVFSKNWIWAVFENRFFPGNIPILKTFSINHGSICDGHDFYQTRYICLYSVKIMFENMYFCVHSWN
jgi:hypothetical protein